MKIAITTQIRENYGTADKPHWKYKGGDTYVVPNLTVEQTLKIKDKGIPTLTSLIEYRNTMSEEYVIDWNILDDDAVVCEPWDAPYNLCYEQGHWVAKRTQLNDEYGYMRDEIASKTEQYVMLVAGERKNYSAVYTMRNGDVVRAEQLYEYVNKAA